MIPFGYLLCVIKCFQFFRLFIWKPFVYQELCWTLGIQIWDIILALKRFKSYHKDSISWEPILSSFLFLWHLEYVLTQINLLKLTMLTPPANIIPNGESWKATSKIQKFTYSWASLVAQMVKSSACDAGDPGSIPGSGRCPGEGNGNPLQYSCLENPMDGGT